MTSALHANETVGQFPPSFYAATTPPLPAFPALAGKGTCDVCIVGGGLSGLSAALHLRRRGYDVVVLDAHRLGWGASGRNGGQIGPGQRVDQIALEAMVGREDARALWDAGLAARQLVLDLVDELGIACDLKRGIIHANHRARLGAHTRAEVNLLRTRYGYEAIDWLGREDICALLGTQAYHNGSFDAQGVHLQPLRYVFALARACIAAGVRVHEKSEVLALDQGAKPLVKTPGGSLRAGHVILAGNGYLGKLDRKVADRVMPINNYIIATEPLGEDLARSLVANDAAVADSKFVINYFRLSGDHRLIFGGRESYGYRFPVDIPAYVRKAMLGIYPQLAGTRIDYGWGGTLGITMNRMPYFDFLAPNILTIGGYSGQGVAMATWGGAVAAQAIAGSAERFDLMARVPTARIPGGYEARLPLLVLGMAWYSLLDRL